MTLADKLLDLHEKSSIPQQIADSDILMGMVKEAINQMAWEIEQSEAGKRGGKQILNPKNNDGYLTYINLSTKSTFPEYLQDIFNGSGTKQKFLSAVKRGKGKVWDRIAFVAVERLKHGYRNAHGYDEPNKDFLRELIDPTPF